MDHTYIDDHNIIDKYGMRKLSAADCARFEEHFVDCPECQARLEASEAFRQALKDAAAEGATQPHWRTRPAWFAWVSRAIGWRLSIAAAAASVLLLAGTTVVLVKQMRALRGELAQARLTAETWQRRADEARVASAGLEEQLRQGHPSPVEQAPETGQPALTGGTGRPEKLPVLASILVLNRVRSADLGGTEPVNRLVLSRSPQWIVLSPDRDEEIDARSYRATLKDSRGRVVWNDHVAGSPASGSPAISLPSTLFRAGDYVLTLEGRSQDGRPVSLVYPFRVQLTP